MENDFTKAYNLQPMDWDSDYFGVKCGKAILYQPLTLADWHNLMDQFPEYQFLSIVNLNSDPQNAQFIGRNTAAFVADINIQFKKELTGNDLMPANVTISQALKWDDQVIDIADFQYSKFIEDPELAKRGGDKIYRHWIANSFDKPEKYFALYRNDQGQIQGFVLHSYSGNACTIELIAVAKDVAHGGIGTELFKAIEGGAFERGIQEVRVGTQVRNTGAINFYHKVGCRHIESHQVYHLWNI